MCLGASFALQFGDFVPRDRSAANSPGRPGIIFRVKGPKNYLLSKPKETWPTSESLRSTAHV